MGLEYEHVDSMPPRTISRAARMEYEQVIESALRQLRPGEALKITDRKRPAQTIVAGLRSAAARHPEGRRLSIIMRAGHAYVAKAERKQ